MLESDVIAETEDRFRRFGGDPENQLALDKIRDAVELTNLYRHFPYPQWNMIGVFEESKSVEYPNVSVALYFRLNGIPLDRLREVYRYEERTSESGPDFEYLGGFAPEGKQVLANIMGKPVRYIPTDGHFRVYIEEAETFNPQIAKSKE